MSILLYVSIAWVTLCVLFVGLDLIFLLIVEHASDTSQAMGADESISDQARQMAKLDLAMDETVRRQACELADTFDAPAQLEDTVTLAPRDATPTADGAVERRTLHSGAVIIRDPRQHVHAPWAIKVVELWKPVPGPRQHRRSARFPRQWKSCLQR